MLYIKFPWAYMLTRKSAETDWSRYETATVREKACSVEVVDIATYESYTANIQIPLIQMHKPSLRMDSSEAERMSELHLSHNRIGLLEARNLIRASCRRLPSESLSELESRGAPKSSGDTFCCFKIFQYLQHVCKWFFFLNWCFKNILRKKERLTYLFGATQKSQEQYTCYCQRWREVTMADLTIKSCIRHGLT